MLVAVVSCTFKFAKSSKMVVAIVGECAKEGIAGRAEQVNKEKKIVKLRQIGS